MYVCVCVRVCICARTCRCAMKVQIASHTRTAIINLCAINRNNNNNNSNSKVIKLIPKSISEPDDWHKCDVNVG